MPAVLSKMLERLPFEEFHALRRHRCSEPELLCVPASMLHAEVPQKRMTTCPRLSWSCHAAKEGIREPELAAQLLRLVDPLPNEVLKSLVSEGFDATTCKYWILQEEAHSFDRDLNDATAQLRRITRNMYIKDKHQATAQRVLNAFKDKVTAELQKGRSLVCWACREPVVKGSTCGRCRIARYCSRKCQERDWETHRHGCTRATQVSR